MASLGGAGELGSATATLLAGAGFTVVAVDRTRNALDELPEHPSRGGRHDRSGYGQDPHRPDRRRGGPP